MRYIVNYRECNITDWHSKKFRFLFFAKLFADSLYKKHYDYISILKYNKKNNSEEIIKYYY